MPGHGTPMSGGKWPVRGERPVSEATREINETIDYLARLEEEEQKKAEEKKKAQLAKKTSLAARYGIRLD